MARCWTTRDLGTKDTQILALIFLLCVPVFIFSLLLYCMPLLVSSPTTVADVPMPSMFRFSWTSSKMSSAFGPVTPDARRPQLHVTSR